jgi:hypothetical protein
MVAGMRLFRGAAGTAAILVVLVGLVYGALLFTLNSARFEQWLKNTTAERTGYEISGAFHFDLLLRLNVAGFSIAQEGRPVMRAERAALTITPLGLFSGTVRRLSLASPVFYLDLKNLMEESGASDVTVRHLEVENGTIVLATGAGDALEFTSLTANAENLSFGGATGLNLRAEVPSIEGLAGLVISGNRDEKTARLVISQPEPGARGSIPGLKRRAREAVTAQLTLAGLPGQTLALTMIGTITALRVGQESISADLEARAALEPGRNRGTLAAKIAAQALPRRIHGLPLALPSGPSALVLNGEFSIANRNFVVQSFHLQSPVGEASGDAQLVFAPEIMVSASNVKLENLPLESWKALLPPPLDRVSGEGQIRGSLQASGPWRSPQVAATLFGTATALEYADFALETLEFKAPVHWAGAKLAAENVSLSGKKLRTTGASPISITAEDVRITGSLEHQSGGAIQALAQWQIGRAGFASADASRIGENLGAAGKLDIRRRPHAPATALAGTFVIERGEVLWGKFFADLRAHQPSLQFDGDYVSGDDALRLRDLRISLVSAGRMAARGTVRQTLENPQLRLEIRGEDLRPAGIFETIVRPNLNRSFPVLDQLALGGRFGLAVTASGTIDNLTVEGSVQLRDGELRNHVTGWQLGPVRLDLPLRVRYPGKQAATPSVSNAPPGELTIGGARFGVEVLPPISTGISLWENALALHDTVRLPLYGGTMEIATVKWSNVIARPRALELSVQAENLQLQRLTSALGWYEFGGSLSGSIPKIEWDGDIVRSEGSIRVQVFGGRMEIDTLEVENPFSAIPSIKLDARFGNINLEQASRTFAFGQISGVLEGTVKGLVITAGQPAAFYADIHSVERSGVSQRISVESLNKITVLSSGTEAGALYGGIASFFDSFRYSKLGFKASLKNDKLSLRGVESRPDGEYLVIGSLLPPTVNVVSHTQVIAFSELLRRLERVQSGQGEKAAK